MIFSMNVDTHRIIFKWQNGLDIGLFYKFIACIVLINLPRICYFVKLGLQVWKYDENLNNLLIDYFNNNSSDIFNKMFKGIDTTLILESNLSQILESYKERKR